MRFLVCMLLMFYAAPAMANPLWAVYYGDQAPEAAFESYELVVFDSDAHPSFRMLQQKGQVVLGYLSLGEAEKYRSYFPMLKAKKLLLQENKLWKGHFVVDIRRPEWQDYVVETLIPAISAKGFDGIMIDTMDSVIYPEQVDPKRFAGMQNSAAALIKTIHARYPELKIMLNRGFELLPMVAGDIDYVMAETVVTDWQPNKKRPVLMKEDAYRETLDKLRQAQVLNPALKIYAVDYWPPKDKEGVKRVYRLQRELGFVPYVSTLDLQHLYKEPQ